MAQVNTIASSSLKFNENTPLPDLAVAIRRFSRVIQDIRAALLRTSMDLGDALTLARARVETRRWKAWRAEHCPEISKRRDEVYRQLAAARPIIERALADNPDLSIRDALKLITTPRPRSPRPKPEALQKWSTLSPDEKRAGLAADGIDALLEYFPPDLRETLADRLERVKRKTAKDRGLTALLREHIKQNPADPLAAYISAQAIDRKQLIVHVGAVDAPSLRRPPLVSATNSASVH